MVALETSRLTLRDWRIEDLSPYARLNSDKKVMAYFPKPLSWDETEAHYLKVKSHIEQYGFGFWAVDERISGKFIGFIGLQWTNFEAEFTPCVEIGWRLDKRYWRKGYATEGAAACLDHAFQHLNLEEVFSFTPVINKPSEGVMKKIGMKKVGEFEHPNVDRNSPLARHALYTITINDWYQLKTASSGH